LREGCARNEAAPKETRGTPGRVKPKSDDESEKWSKVACAAAFVCVCVCVFGYSDAYKRRKSEGLVVVVYIDDVGEQGGCRGRCVKKAAERARSPSSRHVANR